MIKALIFDFAGVIGTDGYWVWLREYVKDIENKREFFQKLSEKADKGLITEQAFISSISNVSGRPSNTVWPEIFQRILINHQLIHVIQKLKKNYKIGLLSNFVYEWLDHLLIHHNLYQYFNEVIISAKQRMIKPEPEIFHEMLKRLGVKPAETIFIDDRQIHVDAANKLGIKSLLFTSTEKLQQDLRDSGIKV